MTTETTLKRSDCPTWCTNFETDGSCIGDHYSEGKYTAATRTAPLYAEAGGAVLPAVGVGVRSYNNQGPDIYIHVTAASGFTTIEGIDEQVDLSITDAVQFATAFVEAIEDAIEGHPTGLPMEEIQPLRDSVTAILAAHGLTEATS